MEFLTNNAAWIFVGVVAFALLLCVISAAKKPGQRGEKGDTGEAGRDGHDGAKGERGELGHVGSQGPPGSAVKKERK